MRKALCLATLAVATCGVFAAPAGLAAADGGALETIARWQADGYQVNVDRVGSGPIRDCIVTSVRNPNTITQLRRINRGDDSILVPVIISRTVQVSLYCP